MLSIEPGYARLHIAHDEEFGQVSESIRSLLHVCHVNGLGGALIVSAQDAFDWRSSLRIGMRFAAAPGGVDGIRLGLVAHHFSDSARRDVLAVAREAALECRIFSSEPEAIAWLTSAGPAP